MKPSILLILVICLLVTKGYTQTEPPQKVYSIVKVQHPFDWYVQQHSLWTAELEQTPNQPDGWLSYYTAARMAKILAPDEATQEIWVKKMDEAVASMQKDIPNTYEYHYILAYHENDRQKKFEYASKAYALDPERPDTYDDLLTYYKLRGQHEKAAQIAKKWKASGDISPAAMLWNYNMLVSTTANAILFTAGDMDTYPAWIMQYADEVRTDVEVINSSLILIKTYRDALLQKMGMPILEGDFVEPKPIIEHIVKHRDQRPIYVAFSANHRVGLEQDHLFNVGLAFHYDEAGNDHLSLLIKNFEQHLLLDHLIYSGHIEAFPSHTKEVNYAYVPGLAMLHKHYGLIGDHQQQQRIKAMIMGIVKGGTQEETVLNMLNDQEKMVQHCQQPEDH